MSPIFFAGCSPIMFQLEKNLPSETVPEIDDRSKVFGQSFTDTFDRKAYRTLGNLKIEKYRLQSVKFICNSNSATIRTSLRLNVAVEVELNSFQLL